MSFPRYPKYKESGVEWLGQVPAHWEVSRLRFVCDVNPPKSETSALDSNTVVSFLPMDAIGEDGSISLEQEKTLKEVQTGYTYFREGDVTLAKITPCFENGKGAIMRGLTNGLGFGTTELIVARPNVQKTTSRFIQYLFASPVFRLLGEAHMYGAGGQKRVPDDFLREYRTGLPPLVEQAAIADFLDREIGKIDELIAEQERLIELLKEKRQAVISHAVTKGLNPDAPMKDSGIEWLGQVPEHWEVVRLGHRGRLQNGLSIGGDAFGEGYPFVSYSDVYNKTTIPLVPSGLVQSSCQDQIKCGLEAGDVLFTRTSETVDDIGVASTCVKTIPRSTFAGFLIRFRPHAGILNSGYSTYLFRNQGVQGHFAGTMNLVTRASLSQGELRNLPICIPPLPEQTAIADFLDLETVKIDTLTTEAQKAITLLQERRAALISAAVTGQIDVKVWQHQVAA